MKKKGFLCLWLGMSVSTVLGQPKLVKLWESDTLMPNVESVIYDPGSNYIYTTNIDGHFMKKDGKGSISQLDLQGNVIDANWISGLDAPTGTGIWGGYLYVTDIDRIVKINLSQQKVEKIYPVPAAKALNDIEIGKNGEVYASDTGGDQIFILQNDKVGLLMDNVDTPNGLLQDGERFLITRWTPKTLDVLNLTSGETTTLADSITGPDGIEKVGENAYLVSGFNGQVYWVDKSGKSLLLDTTGEQVKAADIDYIPAKRMLLIPTMNSNRIIAYRLEN